MSRSPASPPILYAPPAPPLPATLFHPRDAFVQEPPPEIVLEVLDMPEAVRQVSSPVPPEPVSSAIGVALHGWSPAMSAKADELANVEAANASLRQEIHAMRERMEQQRL